MRPSQGSTGAHKSCCVFVGWSSSVGEVSISEVSIRVRRFEAEPCESFATGNQPAYTDVHVWVCERVQPGGSYMS